VISEIQEPEAQRIGHTMNVSKGSTRVDLGVAEYGQGTNGGLKKKTLESATEVLPSD
jgi:hypothetical protein